MFLRSFLIQGSWNYRTMIGGGFGFAVLPALRWLFRTDRKALVEAVGRHSEHFNAHPYMAGLAVGSTVRLEVEGAPEDAVRRFKSAVRGPLGGLGDRLIWAGWLPTTLLTGLILTFLGAPPAVAVITFLGLYNLGHVAFRGWAFHAGLEAGSGIAKTLQAAHLADKTERTQGFATLLLGVLMGVLAARLVTGGAWGLGLALGALASFAIGARVGQRVWRPLSGILTIGLLMLTLAGLVL